MMRRERNSWIKATTRMLFRHARFVGLEPKPLYARGRCMNEIPYAMMKI